MENQSFHHLVHQHEPLLSVTAIAGGLLCARQATDTGFFVHLPHSLSSTRGCSPTLSCMMVQQNLVQPAVLPQCFYAYCAVAGWQQLSSDTRVD